MPPSGRFHLEASGRSFRRHQSQHCKCCRVQEKSTFLQNPSRLSFPSFMLRLPAICVVHSEGLLPFQDTNDVSHHTWFVKGGLKNRAGKRPKTSQEKVQPVQAELIQPTSTSHEPNSRNGWRGVHRINKSEQSVRGIPKLVKQLGEPGDSLKHFPKEINNPTDFIYLLLHLLLLIVNTPD